MAPTKTSISTTAPQLNLQPYLSDHEEIKAVGVYLARQRGLKTRVGLRETLHYIIEIFKKHHPNHLNGGSSPPAPPSAHKLKR